MLGPRQQGLRLHSLQMFPLLGVLPSPQQWSSVVVNGIVHATHTRMKKHTHTNTHNTAFTVTIRTYFGIVTAVLTVPLICGFSRQK